MRHIPIQPNKWAWGECWGKERKCLWFIRIHVPLFRERLLEKVHTTIPKGDFKFTVFLMKFERVAQEAMDISLQVLKESNKSRFESYSVWGTVYWSCHILPFEIVACTFFSDNLSKQLYKIIVGMSYQQGIYNVYHHHHLHHPTSSLSSSSSSSLSEIKSTTVTKIISCLHNQEVFLSGGMISIRTQPGILGTVPLSYFF